MDLDHVGRGQLWQADTSRLDGVGVDVSSVYGGADHLLSDEVDKRRSAELGGDLDPGGAVERRPVTGEVEVDMVVNVGQRVSADARLVAGQRLLGGHGDDPCVMGRQAAGAGSRVAASTRLAGHAQMLIAS